MSSETPPAVRVLIVEDEFLIAADLEHLLTRNGYHVVGPVASFDEALATARDANIDIAILDVRIRGGESHAVAEVLFERQCPYLFATGSAPAELGPTRYHASVLTKPFAHADLLQQLARALAGDHGAPEASSDDTSHSLGGDAVAEGRRSG